jgi:hypothetical protein
MHSKSASSSRSSSSRSFRRALLWGGATAGVLDISAAIVLTLMAGGKVPRMLQGIASAMIGPVSFDLGLATAALGMLMHFAIAFSWAALFLLAARRLPWLLRQPLPTGIAYGTLVYLAMNRVVLPLGAVVRSLYLDNVARSWPTLNLRMLLIHMGCVGLPIALAAWRFAPRADARTAAAVGALPQPDRAS